MPATGARRGQLVYHWKHGWIPLDHFAALSKAHHSKSGAVKVMQKHGIDVHDAYKGAGHNGAPKPRTPAHTAGVDPHAVPSSGGRKMSGKAIPKAGGPAPAEKRAHVTHSGDGTLLSIDRNDTEARDAAKAAGFRWSSNLGSWYLPRNHSESTRRYKVSQLEAKLGKDHVHVEDGGHGKTTTAAEREAARKEASATRADRLDTRAAKHQAEADARYKAARDIMDRIPLGQPILVGHHSERGARADQKRIANHGDKMLLAMSDAKRAQQAADAARHNASSEDSPLKRQRRIDRSEAEIRSIDKRLTEHGIATKAPEQAARVGMRPLSPDYHAKLTAQRAELADQVAHDKAQIAASGHKAVAAADIKAGDVVQYRGRSHFVTKVNKTTVSVPTPYSWEDKVPINQVGKHIPLSTQSDSAVQAAYSNATHAKVKAALAAELKRRGLLTGN